MQSKNGEKYTILVSGASGIVGYGILRSLRERGDCFLIGTTIYPESPANCFSDVVEIVPRTDDPLYFDCLADLIERYSVNMIIPGIEADMSAWNQKRKYLSETGTFLLLNTPELVDLCLDKWKFYEQLEKNGYEGRICSSLERNCFQFPMPFLLKPRCGFGARGIVKIECEEQFAQYAHEIGNRLMMQEYVGNEDEEYTVSVFFDKESQIRAVMGMKRKLSGTGFTEMAEVVDEEQFREEIAQLAKIFKPIGPTNFQFRKHKEKFKLLEINPRISSATSIRAKFGYNESVMAVDYFLTGEQIFQPEILRGKAMRYTEDYIFYDSNHI